MSGWSVVDVDREEARDARHTTEPADIPKQTRREAEADAYELGDLDWRGAWR